MINSSLPSGDAAAAPRSAQACAACKFQRRRCTPDCVLAPYFPADNPYQFDAAHNLFGVRNILKTIKGLDQMQLSKAMTNIIFQSSKRREDPVGGCYRIILEMQRKIAAANAKLRRLLEYRSNLLAQIQAMSGPLRGDQAALPNPISDDPPPTSPQQQQQQEQEQQQKYHNDFCGAESSGIVKGPEEEINPPPSSSALPPTGSDLGQNLPHQQNGEGDQDKLLADVLRPTRHNLEEDQNEVFTFDMDPPPSWSALLPTGSDLGQSLPHHQSGEGDQNNLMADMLQPTHDPLEQDQNVVFPIYFDLPPSWSSLLPPVSDLWQDLPQRESRLGEEDKLMADMLQPTHHNLEKYQNDPPPSSSALPPTVSGLRQDLPQREIALGEVDELMADMLQPTPHNLEQDQNEAFLIGFDPPPSSSALPPTGSDLSQDLPQRECRLAEEDKMTADMLQPTHHNLEEDQNDVFASVLPPPPSSTPLPPTGSDPRQDLPQRENRVGDEDKLTGDTLPPTQHHQPTPLTDAVGLEENQDDIFALDFCNLYLLRLDDDILPCLATPECPSLESLLKRP